MSDAEGRDPTPAVRAGPVLADLETLDEITGGPSGAQRICWTARWREAREFLRARLAELGVDDVETDEAGNLWARMPGVDGTAPALAIGSHLDSVPDGGRLDGALGVMAALGVLRAWAEAGATPPRDLVLLDFADEEGSRFGRSLFGSSALAGTLEPDRLRDLTDADGRSIVGALAENDVDLARAPEANGRLVAIGTYIELHIEQGPVLESEGNPCSAVSGCAGVERFRVSFEGQASHAGTTPMDMRRDAGLAAADSAIEIERIAVRHGGVGTTGVIELAPGVITAIAGTGELGVDLRHAEAGPLASMLAKSVQAIEAAAGRRGCTATRHPVWTIEPVPFDPRLVAEAERASAEVGGRRAAIASGALHDAAELARVVPAAMIFAASIGGISHAKEEASTESSLVAAIDAFGRLAARAV